MRIKLSPIGMDARLFVIRAGDTLTINGKAFDFSDLPDGGTLPAGEVPCEWIVGPVERVAGDLVITLMLPCDYGAPEERWWAEPIVGAPDGPIVFPGDPPGLEHPDGPGDPVWTIDLGKVVTAEMKHAVAQAATKAAFEDAIQAHVDAKPKEKDFRDGVTLASYVASTNLVWAEQAQVFVAWRDAVWAFAYAELAKALSGEREIPTTEAFTAELPLIAWP